MKRAIEGNHLNVQDGKRRLRSNGWMFTSAEVHLAAIQDEHPRVTSTPRPALTRPLVQHAANNPQMVAASLIGASLAPSPSNLPVKKASRSGLINQVMQSRKAKVASKRADTSKHSASQTPASPVAVGVRRPRASSPRSLPLLLPSPVTASGKTPPTTSPFYGFTSPRHVSGSIAADVDLLLNSTPIVYAFSSPRHATPPFVTNVSIHCQSRSSPCYTPPPSSPLRPISADSSVLPYPLTWTPEPSPIAYRGTLSPSVQPLFSRLSTQDGQVNQRRMAIAFRQITTPSPSKKRKLSHRAAALQHRPPRPTTRSSLRLL
ncbi:hypothetical protein H257_15467 [Aphanomyces astaci]|uniref:Uncharacterized protein n=1 Tax=Aphanomyces astaci TaxID=112090 RepID=W4FP01_APHAT|nr:hypothetical protein H257_15467 [Aphanomyces astaci]ETV68661.1 hypothetical protein H257_15467 [Aphanomyces astaci]RQM11597.1 hypothetical protein B5M09_004796 [Aphanomyces astaci]|eukprot:XP_009841886.1 hypothetical protein H257_15467 [Aphanomyces astaci]